MMFGNSLWVVVIWGLGYFYEDELDDGFVMLLV